MSVHAGHGAGRWPGIESRPGTILAARSLDPSSRVLHGEADLQLEGTQAAAGSAQAGAGEL